MIILIDGYNLLHALYPDRLERRLLISFLDRYAQTTSHRLVIIFDAGPDYYPTTERGGKVSVIFSGQMQSADQYLCEYLEDHRNQDILLVTSDREIIETARRFDIPWIASRDFADIIRDKINKRKDSNSVVSTEIIKLSSSNNPELDVLMHQASEDVPLYEEDESDSEVDIFKTKRRKKDKKLWQKIKKL